MKIATIDNGIEKLFFSDDRFEIGTFGIELLDVEECVAPRLHRARVEKVLRLEVHLVHSGVTKCDLKNKTNLMGVHLLRVSQ
jgi:hypothetical protein